MPAKTNQPESPKVEVPKALIDACLNMLKGLEDRDAEAQVMAAEDMQAALEKVCPGIRLGDDAEADEIFGSLTIKKIDKRSMGAGGAWVVGSIAGHDFEAVVYLEHAESASYELDKSRISKLYIRHHLSRTVVANFDRGWDVKPNTPLARRITDLLAAGLAETVFGK